MIAAPTLADLAAASGLQPRTIRSWVAQGILPGPLTRGPAARYPADTLKRLLAIRAMRDLLGMPLAAIRQELLVASAEQVEAYAAKAADLTPEPQDTVSAGPPMPAAPETALDYLRALHMRETAAATPPAGFAEAPAVLLEPPPRGFAALERHLAAGRPAAARKARAEAWLRIPITPDVEFAVRGRLDADQRAQLERCADLVRDILLGRDR
jgi:DNA-binding transcriptional MerR regulator